MPEDVEALREDVVDCFKAQRMSQILDNEERNQLEAVFALRMDQILAEYNALREALEFYANPETYIAIGFFPDPPCGEFMDDFGETGTAEYGPRPGERARKALGYG